MMSCLGGRKRTTVFAPFLEATAYFGDAGKVWMINFRVHDLDAMIAQLRAAGISVELDQQLRSLVRSRRQSN
jgi:hypothetical protein